MRGRARDLGPGDAACPCPCPTRAAAPLRPLSSIAAPADSTPSSPHGAPHPHTYPQLAPASERPQPPRRRPQPHVTLAPLFPCCRLAETRLTLGAQPLVSSEPASPCPVPPLFYARGSPCPSSGGPLFTEFWLFFSGGRRLPPVGSGGQPFRPPSRASPPARSGWPPRN